MTEKIVVVGGGISGLAAAYGLMKEGFDVTVLEKGKRGGGSIRTGMEEGFLYEYGPNSTMNSNDEIDSLCRDLGLENERIFGSERSKRRYILRGGRLHPLPAGIFDFLTTQLWSAKAKLRLLVEPFIGRNRGGEECVAHFVSRRIGRELLDYAIDPFVSGVYAGDPERLSLKSTFPKMDELERRYGSLIIGAVAKAVKGGGGRERKKGLFSFRKGMETLPRTLVQVLGSRFRSGVEVEGLGRKGDVYVLTLAGGGKVEADEVILSAPAYEVARILSDVAPEAAEDLAGIEYAPVAVVYVGFRREDVSHPLDGFGCLFPRKEGRRVLGSLWSSSLFPGRAPEGMVSLTNFIGGAGRGEIVELSDGKLLRLVLEDLKDVLGLKGDPAFVRIIRHRRAIPQYNLGHGGRLERIEAALETLPGIHLLGNYLQGVSVADCVMNGTKKALEITEGFPGRKEEGVRTES